MRNVMPLYRRLLVILLWILVICLAAHFLHDLQPSHLDFQGSGSASRVCHMAIHSGILGGIIPGVALVVLICTVVSFPQVFQHSGLSSIPLPPPILA